MSLISRALCLALALAPVTLVAQQSTPVPATVPASEFVAAPSLTAEQQLRLRVMELQVENAQLRAALAQTQLDAIAREGAAYLSSLQRDGFTLTRGERGWSYVPKGAP